MQKTYNIIGDFMGLIQRKSEQEKARRKKAMKDKKLRKMFERKERKVGRIDKKVENRKALRGIGRLFKLTTAEEKARRKQVREREKEFRKDEREIRKLEKGINKSPKKEISLFKRSSSKQKISDINRKLEERKEERDIYEERYIEEKEKEFGIVDVPKGILEDKFRREISGYSELQDEINRLEGLKEKFDKQEQKRKITLPKRKTAEQKKARKIAKIEKKGSIGKIGMFKIKREANKEIREEEKLRKAIEKGEEKEQKQADKRETKRYKKDLREYKKRKRKLKKNK